VTSQPPMTTCLRVGCLILLACLVVNPSAGVDAREQKASRIISLSPHITELLFAAGAGDLLVGVAEFSDYPPEARILPRIGGHGGIDYEGIVALRPDLVVAWPSGNGPAVLQRLKALGLRVERSDPRTLAAIADDIERLGELAGLGAGARAAAERLRQQLSHLRQQAGQRILRVFYQIWDRPLMTINGRHILSEAIDLCGGRNIFADLAPLTPRVSQEAVLLARPDLILLPADGPTAERWRSQWQAIPGFAAVRLQQLPPDLLQRPTPRMLEGIEQLCLLLRQVGESHP
jgi:iron complex transport system substrate-binding protein